MYHTHATKIIICVMRWDMLSGAGGGGGGVKLPRGEDTILLHHSGALLYVVHILTSSLVLLRVPLFYGP